MYYNNKLLITFITMQIIFSIFTIFFFYKYGMNKFLGNTPKKYYKNIKIGFLITLILNFIIFTYHIFDKNVKGKRINILMFCMIIYYGLFVLYYPLVLLDNKLYVKILLFIIIFPMLYLVYDYYKFEIENRKKFIDSMLQLFTIIPVNQYITYFIRFGLLYN